MKKFLVFTVCALFAIGAVAQKKTIHHAARTKPAFSAEKLKMLCKPWKLDTIEKFGVASPVTAKEQHDGITFMADSTLFLIQEGATKTGKWMMGWSPKYINTVTDNGQTKMTFQVMKLSDNFMELEYQTPDLIRIHYYYSSGKK